MSAGSQPQPASGASPAARSPPRVPSAKTIATWPSSILLDIFLHAAQVARDDADDWVEQREEELRGGTLARWRSNEVLRPLASVCTGWRDAAYTALFRSIHIGSPTAATRLVNTLTANPSLCGKIKCLSVGLSDMRIIAPASTDDLLAMSRDMVQLISLCHNLSLLQIRPLHYAVVPDLFAAMRPLADTLDTLVIGPRHYRSDEAAVLRPMTSGTVEDVVRIMRRLRTLELNCWADGNDAVTATWRGVQDGQRHPPIRIKELGIHAELQDEVLEGLLQECTELEVLDVYLEKEIRLDEVREALQASTSTMKRLRFLVNPPFHQVQPPNTMHEPPVLFDDTLLLNYRVLERLELCNNLASPSIVRILPLSYTVKHLSMNSFAPVAPGTNHFRFTSSLLDDLRDSSRTPAVDALETVRIRDLQAEWGEERVKGLREALEARGVAFKWDEDRDTSQSGGSGSGSRTGSRASGQDGEVEGEGDRSIDSTTGSADATTSASGSAGAGTSGSDPATGGSAGAATRSSAEVTDGGTTSSPPQMGDEGQR
ncbi:hypothetical protein JCM10207_005346 [Rhodosporidiobolus poonsookiae]